MSAQAQMFGTDAEPETLGRVRGPRRSVYIGAKLPRFTLELLRSLFNLQRDDSQTETDQAGEVLEAYVMDSAPAVFGITLPEYVRRRESGESVDLAALFSKRGKKWPQ
jgi:hypothetical protein